jgi:sn-glycerol 3-phosphate transport system substrate-binding protein
MFDRKRLFVTIGLFVLSIMVLGTLTVLAQEPTEVKVWIAFTDDTRVGWSRDRAAEFNAAHPEYNVVIETYENYEAILEATILALEQGTAPAVVQWFEVGTQRARDLGYFKPIATALGDRTDVLGEPINLDDFVAPVSSYYTLDGAFTSMPWNSSTPILYSNTAILEAAGIETPPATWQELEAACATIMAMDTAPEYCITWPNHGWFFEQWMAQQDAPLANNDNGRTERATEVLLDSEASINIAEWWQGMYDQGYYYYSGVQRDWDATQQGIQTGQMAMVITSSADARNISTAAAENDINLITSRMPYDGEVGWTGNLIGGASLWLVDGLDPVVEDGALAFLAYFTNTENAASWHQTTGYLPIRLSAVELLESEGWFEENPNFFTASDQINNTTVTTATRGALLGTFPETRDIVTQAMEDLMLAGGDPAERMAQARADADALLADYNALYGE